MLEDLEICVSYTGTAGDLVREMASHLAGVCRIYVYEYHLDRQAGLYVADVAARLYGRLPCIIFATGDWYTSAATRLELECMKRNPSRKLVFDFCGNFNETEAARDLGKVELGTFDKRGDVSIERLRDWVLSLVRV